MIDPGKESDPGKPHEADSSGPGEDLDEHAPTLPFEPSKTGSERIGPYRILQVIGEGGMGTVYAAQQNRPVQRQVALKVIKLGMDTKEVIARFESERQALAMMNHHNIAKVYDAGATEQGRPFFAMEHVPGLPITDYCDRHRLNTRERLELFIQVCRAIQHAHQKGIIHRDIKPTNILVMMQDGEPVSKVIDFGVAKATNQRLTEHTLFTETGNIIGTPEFMSPEQAEMSALDIDTRSDIYSLGVLLYVLLVGALPFESQGLRGAGYAGVQRIIREVDPEKPSTRLRRLGGDSSKTAASNRRSDVGNLVRQLEGDLDWIVMKTMEKDRMRRYETANGLVLDIQRHLNHEPVRARPPSAAYRMSKFIRRYRGTVATSAAGLLALIIGLVVSTVLYFRAVEAQRDAEEARAREEQQRRRADARAQEARKNLEQAQAAWELADITTLHDLNADAGEFWPAYPQMLPRLEKWTRRASEFGKRLAIHSAALTQLRQGAQPGDTAQAWKFPLEQTQLRHDTLATLVQGLQRFIHEDPHIGTIASVEQRIRAARRVDTALSDAAWETAIDEIARLPIYRGLRLRPQRGLLPLGRCEPTGLWEFWHLQSGARPQPNADLKAVNPWVVTEATGIVLVLIPGGRFTMGAQNTAPLQPNYYQEPLPPEGPVREVAVAAFFLSKYEMNQAQWQRFTGTNPSEFKPGSVLGGKLHTPVHPVEKVSWTRGLTVLQQLGLTLPTEAQWEYATRAGSTSPWPTGAEIEGLEGFANLADRFAKEHQPRSRPDMLHGFDLELDDGYVAHAPVGTFAANPFGLYDVVGNVWEWCRDGFAGYDTPVAPDTGERMAADSDQRVARGGAFAAIARFSRFSCRLGPISPATTWEAVGLRPAREIEK